MDPSPFIQGGAAGAIIAVVILFLRYLKDQRGSDRDERMAERTLWTGTIRDIQAANSQHADKVSASMDALAEKIAKCPTVRGKDESN